MDVEKDGNGLKGPGDAAGDAAKKTIHAAQKRSMVAGRVLKGQCDAEVVASRKWYVQR